MYLYRDTSIPNIQEVFLCTLVEQWGDVYETGGRRHGDPAVSYNAGRAMGDCAQTLPSHVCSERNLETVRMNF